MGLRNKKKATWRIHGGEEALREENKITDERDGYGGMMEIEEGGGTLVAWGWKKATDQLITDQSPYKETEMGYKSWNHTAAQSGGKKNGRRITDKKRTYFRFWYVYMEAYHRYGNFITVWQQHILECTVTVAVPGSAERALLEESAGSLMSNRPSE